MQAVAAIDVGSNAIRLAVVWLTASGQVLRRHNERYALRLGADVFAHGALSPATLEALVEVFGDIASRLHEHGVGRYRAVATSALRDASNGAEAVERIRVRSGVPLEIISGAEEARLVRGVLRQSLGSVPCHALMIDLGGGSLELVPLDADDQGLSLPFGTVRLLARHPHLRGVLSPADLTAVADEVATALKGATADLDTHYDVGVGTGGNLDVLAQLFPRGAGLGRGIDLKALRPFAERLAAMSVDERRDRFNLRPDRADLILPAALVVHALAERFALNTLVVPGTGLREAILRELTPVPPSGLHGRALGAGVGRARAHAEAWLQRARALFSALTPVHGLSTLAFVPLELAAYGICMAQWLDAREVPKHAAYLIRHAVELERDPDVRELACYIAVRAASGGRVRSAEQQLSEDARRHARLLAAILQLTRLPDGHPQAPVHVDLLRDPLRIDLGVALSPETSDGAIRALSRALGRRVELVAAA